MRKRIIMIISVILSVIGLFVLAFLVNNYEKEQKETREHYANLEKELLLLKADKRVAEEALFAIEEDILSNSVHECTVSILIKDIVPELYTEMFPLMKEHGIKGTVVLYKNRLPGSEGAITEEQFAEIISEGYSVVPAWSEDDGDTGIDSVVQWIKDHGYTLGTVVLIDEKNYTQEREDLIVSAGYNTIVRDLDGEKNNAITTGDVEEVWRISAMGYKGKSSKTVLDNAIKAKGHLIYTVGFDAEDESEMYNVGSLANMLEFLKKCENNENPVLINTDIAGARARRISVAEKRAAAIAKNAEEKAAQQKIIDEINQEIDELYKKYN